MMSSVLVSFKDNLLLRNHWTKGFNSWLMTDSIVPSFFAGNKGQCHLQNDARLILKRHFVDHLYKEEKAKDLRSRNNARSSDITEYIAT